MNSLTLCRPVLIALLSVCLISLSGCPGSEDVQAKKSIASSKGESDHMQISPEVIRREYKKVLKVGVPKEQVISAFGKGWPRGTNLVYNLGARSLGPDVETLIIDFDADDRLVQYRVDNG
jgi:hypothetical protein